MTAESIAVSLLPLQNGVTPEVADSVTAVAVVVAYFLLMIGIGVLFVKRAHASTADFWIAGGAVSLRVQVFAFFAAVVSGGTFFGIGGMAYGFGLGAMAVFLSAILGGLVFMMIFVAAPMRRAGVYTVPDYLKLRYNSNAVRIVAALLFATFSWAYLIPQLTAAGITIDFVLPNVGYGAGVFIATVVFALYVSVGGMWAVTWTDFIQGVIVMFVAVAPVPFIIWDLGAGGSISAAIANDPGFGGTTAPGLFLVGLAVTWVLAPLGLPYFGQRILSSDTDRVARRSIMWVSVVYLIVFTLMGVFVSAGAMAIEPNLADADYFYYAVLAEYAGPIIQGFGAAALFAAVMSTTDALLIALSASLGHDIPETMGIDLDERKETWLGAIITWTGAITAAWVALSPPSIIALMITLVAGAAASGLFPAMAIGTWWKRANAYGAIAAMLAGTLTYGGLLAFDVMAVENAEVLVSVPVGIAALVIGSYATARPGPKELRNFQKFHEKKPDQSITTQADD
jgi:Na+/proline symporter